jgi:DNA-binding MarR family transcriptional regulator
VPEAHTGVQVVTFGLHSLFLGSERYRRTLAEALNVGDAEIVVMGHLYNFGPLTPREIADRLGFSTGSTTAVLDRTERVGYASRKPNPSDRRSRLIVLTPGGRHAMRWVYEQTTAHIAGVFQEFGAEELSRLAALMSAVGESLLHIQVNTTATPEPTRAERNPTISAGRYLDRNAAARIAETTSTSG